MHLFIYLLRSSEAKTHTNHVDFEPIYRSIKKKPDATVFQTLLEGSLSFMFSQASLTLSGPVVFLNSPNLSPYFSLNKFERI